MKSTFKLSLLVIAVASLTACGGGGGSDSSATAPVAKAPVVNPVASESAVITPNTLSTTILASTYATGSNEQINYDRINQVRLVGGFGTVAQDRGIDMAALSHSKYVTTNYYNSKIGEMNLVDPATGWLTAHVEHPTLTGFTGALPMDRIAAVGRVLTWAGEVASNTNNVSCIDTQLNSVFHRSAVLDTRTQFIGFGLHNADMISTSLDTGTGIVTPWVYKRDFCTIEYGATVSNTVPQSWTGVYPGLNQTNVPIGMGTEVPNPAVEIAQKGSPVSIYFGGAIGKVDSFTITASGSSTPTSVKLIMKKDFPSYLTDNEAHILPTQFLAKLTTYNVSFKGSLVNGTAVSKDWSFTTGN